MPCYTPEPEPTQEELNAKERVKNNKKYGFYKTNSELITHLLNMCCEMSEVIFESKLQHRLSHDTLEWCEFHQIRDEKVKAIMEELSKLNSDAINANNVLNKVKERKKILEERLEELNA